MSDLQILRNGPDGRQVMQPRHIRNFFAEIVYAAAALLLVDCWQWVTQARAPNPLEPEKILQWQNVSHCKSIKSSKGFEVCSRSQQDPTLGLGRVQQ